MSKSRALPKPSPPGGAGPSIPAYAPRYCSWPARRMTHAPPAPGNSAAPRSRCRHTSKDCASSIAAACAPAPAFARASRQHGRLRQAAETAGSGIALLPLLFGSRDHPRLPALRGLVGRRNLVGFQLGGFRGARLLHALVASQERQRQPEISQPVVLPDTVPAGIA